MAQELGYGYLEDLVNWSYAGYATEEPVTTIIRPVVYSNGKFYMYTSPGGMGTTYSQVTARWGLSNCRLTILA